MRADIWVLAFSSLLGLPSLLPAQSPLATERAALRAMEFPDMPPAPASVIEGRSTSKAQRFTHGGFTSVQVNVNGQGLNIVGDAANEPSIAVDPLDSSEIIIGWRQFDSISSSFREAGIGRSTDGGQTFTSGVLDNGVFRSDPVLTVDRDGIFHYYSLRVVNGGAELRCELYTSEDGGATWPPTPVDAFGGDKAWIETDRSETGSSLGIGQLYATWNATFSCCGSDSFNRSIDAGASFQAPVQLPDQPFWGTVTVGPDGEVYTAGVSDSVAGRIAVVKSTNAQDANQTLAFATPVLVDLGGSPSSGGTPNPAGLNGQVWVDVDRSSGPRRGWVYLLSSVDPPGADPLDVHFSRSSDGGQTWSPAQRLNSVTTGWQWFGTMAVGPNGRIDVVWNDTRNAGGGVQSELFHTYSTDGGQTWAADQAITPSFNPLVGFPQQNKIGDYYHMVANHQGAHLTYAATFNGEEDVYYLRIPHDQLFADGFETGSTQAWSAASP